MIPGFYFSIPVIGFGSFYLVFGSWFLVLDPWFGSQLLVLSSWYFVRKSYFLLLAHKFLSQICEWVFFHDPFFLYVNLLLCSIYAFNVFISFYVLSVLRPNSYFKASSSCFQLLFDGFLFLFLISEFVGLWSLVSKWDKKRVFVNSGRKPMDSLWFLERKESSWCGTWHALIFWLQNMCKRPHLGLERLRLMRSKKREGIWWVFGSFCYFFSSWSYGFLSPAAKKLILSFAWKLYEATGEIRSWEYCELRLSVELRKSNAACVFATLPPNLNQTKFLIWFSDIFVFRLCFCSRPAQVFKSPPVL